MEESYQFAVKRETLHNIHSYSYELEHVISGHSAAFQGKSQDSGAKLGMEGICLELWRVVDGRERDVRIAWLMGCLLYMHGLPQILPAHSSSEPE